MRARLPVQLGPLLWSAAGGVGAPPRTSRAAPVTPMRGRAQAHAAGRRDQEQAVSRQLECGTSSPVTSVKKATSRDVKTLVTVFLTNGHGEAVAANPVYLDLIGRFDPEQASLALRACADAEISSQLPAPVVPEEVGRTSERDRCQDHWTARG
jgi:hypothetical protein